MSAYHDHRWGTDITDLRDACSEPLDNPIHASRPYALQSHDWHAATLSSVVYLPPDTIGQNPDKFAFLSYSQEKAKKVLDIWLKSNTFPSAVLSRLHKLVKESKEKGACHVLLCFAKYFPHLCNPNHFPVTWLKCEM